MPTGFQGVPRRYRHASGRWREPLKRELSNDPLHLPTERLPYTALPQARHLRAAAGTVSRQSGQALVAGVGAAGAGFRSALVIMNTQAAMMTKSTTDPMNAP